MNTASLFNRRRAIVATGILALAGVFVGVQGAQSPTNESIAIRRDVQPLKRTPMEPSSFADVVKRVSPSVVKITTETKARSRSVQDNPMLADPFFRQFFGNRIPEMRREPLAGLGSGVVISPDGFIVTNNHVVDNADTVMVDFPDGREFTAKIVGRDPQTDIAVIKVDARDLPSVTLADSDSVEVGDRVLAIGNPFGIGETVTSGIVSAKGRNVGILQEVEGYESFIQTDAAINPGNSGGALVDVQGRLIGINSAILSRSGGFQGVGFAVPANMVSFVADSLVKSGKVVRSYLGVYMQNLTPALADQFKLKDRRGALVTDIEPGSPGAKAGIKTGDVITKINGRPVKDGNELRLAVTSTPPGTKIAIEVSRDGEARQLTATTSERPNTGRLARGSGNSAPDFGDDSGVLNGVAVDDIDPQARQQFNIPSRIRGALVTSVEPDSASARAGLRPGDVIVEINKQPVTTAQQAVDLTAKSESRKTLVKLWSRGNTVFVVVDETQNES